MQSLNEILLAQGAGTSDVAVKRELVKMVLYKVSNLLATGTKLIPVVNYDVLDVKSTFPDEGITVEYPVPEGAQSNQTNINWTEYGYSLGKAQAKFTITMESVIRGIDQQQNRRSFQRGAEDMAKKKDENILTTLYTGAGQSQTISNPWDGASGTPAKDVADAYGKILGNTNITDAEMGNIWMVVPAVPYARLMQLQEINNINQTLKAWLSSTYGMTIVPTRSTGLGKHAIMVVNSQETGEHGVYTGNQVPLSESERIAGVGDKFTITQFFATKVVPTSDSVATTTRILKMDNVAT